MDSLTIERQNETNEMLSQDSSLGLDKTRPEQIFQIIKIKNKKKWTREEDLLLISLAEQHREKHWKDISKNFVNKNALQCFSRYKRIRPGIVKGAWGREEDEKIMKLVQVYGKAWSKISKVLVTRNGKQIRDRFINVLDPEIKKGKFTEEEDNLLISLYMHYGPKWATIAKHFLNRTADMIKNRFHSSIKKLFYNNSLRRSFLSKKIDIPLPIQPVKVESQGKVHKNSISSNTSYEHATCLTNATNNISFSYCDSNSKTPSPDANVSKPTLTTQNAFIYPQESDPVMNDYPEYNDYCKEYKEYKDYKNYLNNQDEEMQDMQHIQPNFDENLHMEDDLSIGVVKRERKSNCANTLFKFYKPEVDYVTKLNFYSPEQDKKTMYSVRGSIMGDPLTGQINMANPIAKMKTKLPSFFDTYESVAPTHQFSYLQKIEVKSSEHDFEEKRRKIEENIKDNKSEIKKLYSQLGVYKNEKAEIEIDIEYLSNLYKYTGFEQKFNNMHMKKGAIDHSEVDMLKVKKILDLKNDKREGEISQKNKEKLQREKMIKGIRELIQKYTDLNKTLIQEHNELSSTLLMHYHKLLTEAKETRKEGLTWIIKAIWNLGQKVIPSCLPHFLDEKSISYLFNYSSSEVELNKIKKKLDDVHLLMRIKKDKIVGSNNKLNLNLLSPSNQMAGSQNNFRKTNGTFKTEMESNNKEDLTEILNFDNEINKDVIKKLVDKYKKENNLYDEVINFKTINEFIMKRGQIDKESAQYINTVNELEKKIKELTLVLQQMKKIELDRINKEFYSKEYGRRFNVTHQKMISVLVGEENVFKEYSRHMRDQKIYFKQIENLRTYTKFELIGPNRNRLSSQSIDFQ